MALKQSFNSNTAPDGSTYVTLTDGDGNLGSSPLSVTASDPLLCKEVKSSVATQTSVASSATDVLLAAANPGRLGLTIYNDSTQILYVLLGSSISTTSNYTVQMQSGAYYEMPFGYAGTVRGIWASANGNARITELT